MSLTGLEAFTNTYFHVRADQLGSDEILARIAQTHGSLTRKLTDLVGMTPDGPLRDEEMLIDRLFALCRLRNDAMHPRWEPSAPTIEGEVPVHILGLAENPHMLFEDDTLCRETMLWCLLAIGRVGQTAGFTPLNGFLFHWKGNYGLELAHILEALGLPAEH